MTMKLFPAAHATHPQWDMAVELVLAQLRAQMALPAYAPAPTLGLVYLTDAYASAARQILARLRAELGWIRAWAGTTGVGVLANNAEYIDEPALSVMLCDLHPDAFRVFSGIVPLVDAPPGMRAHTALVHASPDADDLPGLIVDLAKRTETGDLFGGLSSGRGTPLQFAVARYPAGLDPTDGVYAGGLSGVAFSVGVPMISRVTQGCRPISRERRVTEAEGNLLLRIDDEPALDLLLRELAVSLDTPMEAVETVRVTLVGLADASSDGLRRTGDLDANVRVRHIIGLDPARRGIAIADEAAAGTRLVFCQRNAQAARADLMRICAEIREELEPAEQSLEVASAVAAGEAEAAPHPARRIAGAVYVSCMGRGGAHFGAPGAEMQIVRRTLGDVPLTGFFAGGEIARDRLYGYTGVLTVFVAD